MRPGEKSKIVIIKAVNPVSVVCPESILVNVLTTLGVLLHPEAGSDYAEFREVLPDGKVQRTLRWTLLHESRDKKYKTAELIEWWHDEAWLAAHPTHELTTHKIAATNMLRLADRVRRTPHLEVYRKGKHVIYIPSQLAEAEKQKQRARLENIDA